MEYDSRSVLQINESSAIDLHSYRVTSYVIVYVDFDFNFDYSCSDTI